MATPTLCISGHSAALSLPHAGAAVSLLMPRGHCFPHPGLPALQFLQTEENPDASSSEPAERNEEATNQTIHDVHRVCVCVCATGRWCCCPSVWQSCLLKYITVLCNDKARFVVVSNSPTFLCWTNASMLRPSYLSLARANHHMHHTVMTTNQLVYAPSKCTISNRPVEARVHFSNSFFWPSWGTSNLCLIRGAQPMHTQPPSLCHG
jgi:hypothetical protein